jgi:hypothetical protein
VAADNWNYANTLVHELGHVLTLKHRAEDADGLPKGNHENIMYNDVPKKLYEYCVLIQASAVLGSPVVQLAP